MVFTVSGVTDGLDGLLARRFNQRTSLGATLDPIADKLLLVSAFLCLGIFHMTPAWLVVVVIGRDLLILAGITGFHFASYPIEIRPSLISKCTTAAQMALIMMILLELHLPMIGPAKIALVWVTAGFTLLSGADYFRTGMRMLQEREAENRPER